MMAPYLVRTVEDHKIGSLVDAQVRKISILWDYVVDC